MKSLRLFGVTLYLGSAVLTAHADTFGSIGYNYQNQELKLNGGGKIKANLQGVAIDIFEQEQGSSIYGNLVGRFLVADGDVTGDVGDSSRERLWSGEYRLGARLTPMLGLYTGIGYQNWRSKIDVGEDTNEITRKQLYSPIGLDLLGQLSSVGGWRLFAEYGVLWSGKNKIETADSTTKPNQDSGHYYQVGAQAWYRLSPDMQLEVGPYYRRWDVKKADQDAVQGYKVSSYGIIVSLAY